MNAKTKLLAGAALSLGIASAAYAGIAFAQDASPENAAPAITAVQAGQIALENSPGTITEIELEKEDGGIVWEVEIVGDGGEIELEIDAATGEVLSMEEDDDKHEWFGWLDGDDDKSGRHDG